jgi:hypothetical protein
MNEAPKPSPFQQRASAEAGETYDRYAVSTQLW